MLTKEEKIIIQAARRGGEVLKQYFGQELATYRKTVRADFYTEADTEAEKIVIKALEDLKDCNIQAEESGFLDHGGTRTIVIDPLDGTNNFALGLAYFSVGIALEVGGETVFTAIYHPVLDDLYYAKKGYGAFKNDQSVMVRRQKDIKELTLAYTCGYSNVRDLRTPLQKELYQLDMKRFLDNWCPTLDYCLLASGRIDGVIANDDDTGESAIGMLMIKEAGGYILDFEGQNCQATNAPHFIAAAAGKWQIDWRE